MLGNWKNTNSLPIHQFSSKMISLRSRDGSSLLLDEFEGIHDITSNEVQEHHNSVISAQQRFQKNFETPLISNK